MSAPDPGDLRRVPAVGHARNPAGPVLAGPPRGPVAVPAAVAALAAGTPADPVWVNGVGGVTFALPASRRYVKWHPAGSSATFDGEAARLAWAGRFTPVPLVLERGADDEGAWLVTRAVPGRSAVDERWLAEPEAAVRAIGAGLRAMHDALPVDACPFDWGVAWRLARAEREGTGSSAARAVLGKPPEVDRLVVCHGDACAPNTLLADDGAWSAHVDLGALGVADRWADLAVATYSLGWNYGPGWEPVLLDAYGVAADDERTAYYRALWDAT